jgi:hypothetical protein
MISKKYNSSIISTKFGIYCEVVTEVDLKCDRFGFGLWYLTPLSTVSFIGGGNRSTQRKSPTCCKSLTLDSTLILI